MPIAKENILYFQYIANIIFIFYMQYIFIFYLQFVAFDVKIFTRKYAEENFENI